MFFAWRKVISNTQPQGLNKNRTCKTTIRCTNQTKKKPHAKDYNNEKFEMYIHVQHQYKVPTESKTKLKSRLSRRSFKVQS